MREKLIELLDNFSVYDDWYTNGEIAEHLIANDVVPVVRCKDCRHWLPEEPERCKALKQEPYGLCNRYPQRTDWQDTTDHDDFCSYGERKDK